MPSFAQMKFHELNENKVRIASLDNLSEIIYNNRYCILYELKSKLKGYADLMNKEYFEDCFNSKSDMGVQLQKLLTASIELISQNLEIDFKHVDAKGYDWLYNGRVKIEQKVKLVNDKNIELINYWNGCKFSNKTDYHMLWAINTKYNHIFSAFGTILSLRKTKAKWSKNNSIKSSSNQLRIPKHKIGSNTFFGHFEQKRKNNVAILESV